MEKRGENGKNGKNRRNGKKITWFNLHLLRSSCSIHPISCNILVFSRLASSLAVGIAPPSTDGPVIPTTMPVEPGGADPLERLAEFQFFKGSRRSSGRAVKNLFPRAVRCLIVVRHWCFCLCASKTIKRRLLCPISIDIYPYYSMGFTDSFLCIPLHYVHHELASRCATKYAQAHLRMRFLVCWVPA